MKPEWTACEYSYRIHRSPGDHGYVATVAEFPRLQSPPAATPGAALSTLTTAVVEQLYRLDSDGRARPLAFAVSGSDR